MSMTAGKEVAASKSGLGVVRAGLALGVAYTATATVNAELTMLNVALPSMARDLDLEVHQAQWVVDAYSLGLAACTLLAGVFARRIGLRRTMVTAALGFAWAAVFGSFASEAAPLVASRAVMGVCAAALLASAMIVLLETFPDGQGRALAIGGWGAVAALAVAVGPVAGGALVQAFDWTAVYLVAAPLGGLVALLAVVRREAPVPPSSAVDGVGLVLGTATLTLATVALIEAPRAGWTSEFTLKTGGCALLFLVSFLVWHARSKETLVPATLRRDKNAIVAIASLAIAFFALDGLLLLATLYLQFLQQYSPLETGVRILPCAAATAVVSVLAGALATRLRLRRAVVVGASLICSALLWISTTLAVTPGAGSYWTELFPQLVLFGAGIALVITPATSAASVGDDVADPGLVAALNGASREAGAILGVAVSGSVLSTVVVGRVEPAWSAPGRPDALTLLANADRVAPTIVVLGQEGFVSGMQVALTVMAAIVGVSAVLLVAWSLLSQRARSQRADDPVRRKQDISKQ